MKNLVLNGLFLIVSLLLHQHTLAQKTVSDEQLKTVAELYETSLIEGEKIQEQLDSLLQKEGITPERYREIQRMKNDRDLSEAEKATVNKIEQARSEFSASFDKMIVNKGMTPVEYRKILYDMQNDEELQERFTEIITKTNEQ